MANVPAVRHLVDLHDEERLGADDAADMVNLLCQFCMTFGTALHGRAAYAVGYTALGVAATRFGARVALDLVDGADTERTRLSMVRSKAIPFGCGSSEGTG
jgi:hypothetical protein